ncbi:hypothetical protein FHETE_9359 [Fusarium heterosporum]|uniref:Uncharacterized protein n=1 Tax=Fusarium heterosporum TaxID=42747 RepID=A0A8H5STD5_FUSHE|nr:hypothetical protein FHETE_9359 [Fusarium heterosporum]
MGRGPRKNQLSTERAVPFPSQDANCDPPYSMAEGCSLSKAETYHYMRTQLEAQYIRNIFTQFHQPLCQQGLELSLPHNGIDYCNKSIPLFVLPGRGCHPSIHRLAQIAILTYVYRRTFRPYRTDIEYEPFLVKLLAVQDAFPTESETMAVMEAVWLHKALCHSLDTVFEEKSFPHRIVHPLFKSMMITIPMHDYRCCGRLRNIGDLRAFITIVVASEGLEDRLKTSPCNIGNDIFYFGDGDIGTVQTTLGKAISFAIECDDSYKDTPGARPDPLQSTVDPEDAVALYGKVKKGVVTEDLPVVGPSSRWVDTRDSRFHNWTGEGAECRILERTLQDEFENHRKHGCWHCMGDRLDSLPRVY